LALTTALDDNYTFPDYFNYAANSCGFWVVLTGSHVGTLNG